MHRSNYTQEVGLKTNCQTVSKPVAIAVLALAAAGLWMGGRELQARSHARQAQEQLAAAAEAAAHPPVAKK